MASMAVLIVDDETSTRNVLREFVEALGFGPIMEARNGKEAIQMLEQPKSKIELIISDREMPVKDGLELLAAVGGMPTHDRTPFLLVTSEEIEIPDPRLDGLLPKPFQLDTLRKALFNACARNSERRSSALCIGKRILPDLKNAFQVLNSNRWRELIVCEPGEAFVKEIERYHKTLGAIFFECKSVTEADALMLSQFKKTPLGIGTQVICVMESFEDALPFRMGSDQFFLQGASRESWQTLLEQLAKSRRTGLEQRLLQQDFKTKIQGKDFKSARSVAEKLIQLDPRNADYAIWLSRALNAQRKKEEALQVLRDALELNPFSSQAYLGMLPLLADDRVYLLTFAEKAARLCPNSVEVLAAAARAYRDAGSEKECQLLVESILKIDPKNAVALALRAP
jgi:two-component system chemotaxis response regulator CheY